MSLWLLTLLFQGPILRAKENVDFYNIDPLECDDYQNISFVEMGNINIYDIYQDVCLSNGTSNQVTTLLIQPGCTISLIEVVAKARQLMKYLGSSDAPLSTFFQIKEDSIDEQQACNRTSIY